MNDLFLDWGLQHFKPLATALLLPPVPLVALILIGLAAIKRRRRVGTALALGGVALVWISACMGFANLVAPSLLHLPAALTNAQIHELARHAREPVAIIVLGNGVEAWAPEYQTSSLQYRSLERLRYGIWLGRRTGWPVGFSGGVGWGQPAKDPSVSEAGAAQRIATAEFGHPLRWAEATSRDTRENALNTIALLRPEGIKRIVLVTNAWHMQRALRNFERAAGADPIRIEPAPMGLAMENEPPWMRWMPSGDGMSLTRTVLREWLGLRAGA